MPKSSKIKVEPVETIKTEKKTKQPSFYQAVGRRRDATARVRLYVMSDEKSITVKGVEIKAGDILINKKKAAEYFAGEVSEKIYLEPFKTTNTVGRFAVSAIIKGGGNIGQLLAFVHGASRSLEKVDKEKFRVLLKKKGFLKRDPRTKERRKAGFAQKARARKQSPKR